MEEEVFVGNGFDNNVILTSEVASAISSVSILPCKFALLKPAAADIAPSVSITIFSILPAVVVRYTSFTEDILYTLSLSAGTSVPS